LRVNSILPFVERGYLPFVERDAVKVSRIRRIGRAENAATGMALAELV
jgi:hypothetical protein